MSLDHKAPAVIDNGTGYTKMGFGECQPPTTTSTLTTVERA